MMAGCHTEPVPFIPKLDQSGDVVRTKRISLLNAYQRIEAMPRGFYGRKLSFHFADSGNDLRAPSLDAFELLSWNPHCIFGIQFGELRLKSNLLSNEALMLHQQVSTLTGELGDRVFQLLGHAFLSRSAGGTNCMCSTSKISSSVLPAMTLPSFIMPRVVSHL